MCPLVVQVGAIYVAEPGAKNLFINDFIHKIRVGFREVGMYLPAVSYLIYLVISLSTKALGTEYSAPTTSQCTYVMILQPAEFELRTRGAATTTSI